MSDWDTGSPADDDIISVFPANERTQRGAQETIFGADHHEEDDADQGKHEAIRALDQVTDPASASGQGVFYGKTVDGIVEAFYRDSEGNVVQFSDIGQSALGRIRVITPDTATTHTATAADNGGIVVFDDAADCFLTLPEQTSETLRVGFHVLVKNIGGGNVRVLLEGTDTLDGISLSQNPELPVALLLEDNSDPNFWSIIGNEWIPIFVVADDLTEPPVTDPFVGAVFIVDAPAENDWAGQEDLFAIYVGSGDYEFTDSPISAAGMGHLYRKTVGGTVELFYRDTNRAVIRLTVGGVMNNPEVLVLPEQASGPPTLAGGGKLYTKDVNSLKELFYRNSAGDEVRMTRGSQSAAEGGTVAPDAPTAHTATAGQNGFTIIFDSASDVTLTLPEQATEALSAGYTVSAVNIGGGNVLFAAEGSDSIVGVPLSEYPDRRVTAFLRSTDTNNTWVIEDNKWIDTAHDIAEFRQAPPGTDPALRTIYVVDALAGTPSGGFSGWDWHFAIYVGGGNYGFVPMPTTWFCLKRDTYQNMFIDTITPYYEDFNN